MCIRECEKGLNRDTSCLMKVNFGATTHILMKVLPKLQTELLGPCFIQVNSPAIKSSVSDFY